MGFARSGITCGRADVEDLCSHLVLLRDAIQTLVPCSMFSSMFSDS